MKELDQRMNWGIENLKKCFEAPDKLVKSHLKDNLKFDLSIHYINTAIEKKLITQADFLTRLGCDVKNQSKNNQENEECLQ